MKNILIFIAGMLALIPSAVFAQNVEGCLILGLLDNVCDSECLNFSSEGFTVYNLDKEKTGRLEASNDWYSLYFINNSNVKTKIGDFHQVGYEAYALVYKLQNDGFVEIGVNEQPFLLRIEEIETLGFKAVPWIQHLIRKCGYGRCYAKTPGMNLRTTPSVDSDVIGLVHGDLFEISVMDDCNGNWCKVIVTKSKEHFCVTSLNDEDNLEYTKEGWMKVLDDDGSSNLFYYPRGC